MGTIRVAPELHRAVLPSGITVIGEEMPSLRSHSVGAWLRVGSRHETEEDSGLSHFLEHMVFKGTEKRDAYEIAYAMESVGGQVDAFTGREQTCFLARGLSEFLPVTLDVLADLVLAPRLTAEDIEKEKKVILDEIHQYEDTPDDRIHDLFADVVLRGHPLGRRILGSEETVRSFRPEQVHRYHVRHYTAPNLVVAVAGGFQWDSFLALTEERFARAPAGARDRSETALDAAAGVVHHEKDLAQQYLCIGAQGLKHVHPDRQALVLLGTLLGGGMSSRLFQRVREEEGLAYSIFTYSDSYEDAGIFCASMSVLPDHGRRAVRLTLEEFERVADEGVPEDELRSVKAQIKGSLLLGLESSSRRMNRIARSEIYYGRPVPLDDLIDEVEAISSEDVRRVAGSVLARGRLSLVALGASSGRAYGAEDLNGGVP
jgi:predicted Zn-dependent peptidase